MTSDMITAKNNNNSNNNNQEKQLAQPTFQQVLRFLFFKMFNMYWYILRKSTRRLLTRVCYREILFVSLSILSMILVFHMFKVPDMACFRLTTHAKIEKNKAQRA